MMIVIQHATFLILVSIVRGQFGRFMSPMMSSGSGSGSNCLGISVSCLPSPWCKREVDNNGCMTCNCNLGNVLTKNESESSDSKTSQQPQVHGPQNPSQAMNPFLAMQMNGGGGISNFGGLPSILSGNIGGFGGGSQMGQMGPINPMASILGGNSMYAGSVGGPSAPLFGGSNPNSPQPQSETGNKNCARINTCMLPPPWCQRVIDVDGCTKCYCGQDLQKYIDALSGVEVEPTATEKLITADDKNTVTSSLVTSEFPSQTSTEAPPFGLACLETFQCTLSCNDGYQTDNVGCPVCACSGDVSQSFAQENTAIQDFTVTPSPPASGTVDNSLVLCPGIFDCQKLCVNGFQIDSQGCPLCECDDN